MVRLAPRAHARCRVPAPTHRTSRSTRRTIELHPVLEVRLRNRPLRALLPLTAVLCDDAHRRQVNVEPRRHRSAHPPAVRATEGVAEVRMSVACSAHARSVPSHEWSADSDRDGFLTHTEAVACADALRLHALLHRCVMQASDGSSCFGRLAGADLQLNLSEHMHAFVPCLVSRLPDVCRTRICE
jgi:hypothetical protein